MLCGNLLSISQLSHRHTKGLQTIIYQKGENWFLGGYLLLQVTAEEEKVASWPPSRHHRLHLHLSASPTSQQLVFGCKLALGKSQEATIPLWGAGARVCPGPAAGTQTAALTAVAPSLIQWEAGKQKVVEVPAW